MYSRILVPLDRSAFAENAITYAVAVAHQSGGTIHLVNVHSGILAEAVRPAPVVFETGFDSMLVREEQEYLETLARSLGANHDVSATAELLQGPVSEAIAKYVREASIDLVVMSTHGHGGLRRAWLGSNADRLLRRLKVPVLLIRPVDSITPVASFDQFSRVLIAFDGSAVAEAALDAAAELPFADGAHCTLMRVATVPMIGSPYLPDAARASRDELEERTEAAERYLETMAPEAAGHWAIVDRHVIASYRTADAILDHADRVHADLIVIGTHGRTRIGRAILGGVADKVIRGADTPVFVYPARALARKRQSASRRTGVRVGAI